MEMQELISLSLEETLAEIYTEMGIETGDISPMQSVKWDEITRTAADLFLELIEQNKGDF